MRLPFFTKRREARKLAEARMGKATSGHLDSRARAGLFAKHRRLPK